MKDILNFANTINKVNINEIDENELLNENCNVFRKDEIKEFEDKGSLLENAPQKQANMFQIPKVMQ